MSVINEVIREEVGGGLSFGNYSMKEKQKVHDYEVNGDIYYVKTHKEVTRIEKNSKLLFESVPGSTVHNFKISEKIVTFSAEGFEDTQITVELLPEREYKIIIDDLNVGSTVSKLSGKISFSVGLSSVPSNVKIEKI